MSLRPAAVVLATLAVLMGIGGAWSPAAAVSTIWTLPAALLLLGLAYESLMNARAHPTLRIVAPGPWLLGRSTSVQFEFRHALANRTVSVQVAPRAPDDFAVDGAIRTVSIAAGAPAGLKLPVVPRGLGVHVWPPVRARVGGVLGLAWWPRDLKDECTVRVAPDLLGDARKAAGIGAVGTRSGRTQGAGSELLQLRPYQPGDSLRTIDWKATARSLRLSSRDFSEDQHLELLILIDAGRTSGFGAGELDRFGHYVNLAARLAQFAVSQDDRVGLIIFADRPMLELKPARGAASVVRIRAALGAARVERAESNPLQAAVRARSLVHHRSLVVMLTDVDDATGAGQLAAAVRFLLPKHLPFVAGLSSGAAEQMAQAAAHRWVDPYRALAAQEYCLGLERKLRALRSMGAPALIARPEQLDGAVFEAYSAFRRRRRV